MMCRIVLIISLLFSSNLLAQRVTNIDHKGTKLTTGVVVTESATAPTNPSPIQGDIWFDTTTGITKTHDGAAWKEIDPDKVTEAATQPTGTAVEGDFWIDTANDLLKIYDNGSWKIVASTNFAKNEPWFGTDDDAGATENTEDIYHMGGNVGLGTSDPTEQLTISTGADTDAPGILLHRNSANNPAGIYMSYGSNAKTVGFQADRNMGGTNNGGLQLIASNNRPIQFYTKMAASGTNLYNVQEAGRFNGNGNFGIGTNAPSEKLDVNGEARIRTLNAGDTNNDEVVVADNTGVLKKVAVSDVGTDDQKIDSLTLVNDTLRISLEDDGEIPLTLDLSELSNDWKLLGNAGTSADTNFVGTIDAQDLVFRTNNQERLRIKQGDSARVLLANPGDFATPGLSSSAVIGIDSTTHGRLRITAGNNETFDDSQGASIDLHGNNASANTGVLDLVAGQAADSTKAAIKFWTNTDGSTQQTSAVITGEGNMGLGTTAPTQRLHIDSNMRLTGAFYDGTNSPGEDRDFLVSRGDSITEWVSIRKPNVKAVGTPLVDDANSRLRNGTAVWIQGKTAYYLSNADNAMTSIDISNPLELKIIGEVTGLHQPNDVHVYGDYAYIASLNGGGLRVVNIANPANMTVVKNVGGSTGRGWIAGQGHYLYVGGGHNQSMDEFFVLDIADPENPVKVAHLDGAHFRHTAGIDVQGDYVYVVNNNRYGGTGHNFTILDVSDPTNPTIVSTVHDDGTMLMNTPASICVKGNYAFIVNGNYNTAGSSSEDGLNIFDISDPANPTLVSTLKNDSPTTNQLGAAYHVTVQGDFAYVTAIGDDALTVIDIQDPENPEIIQEVKDNSTSTVGGAFRGINWFEVQGNYGYSASWTNHSFQVFELGVNEMYGLEVGSLEASTLHINDKSSFMANADFKTGITVGGSASFEESIALQKRLFDGDGDGGTSGQLLSATDSTINWVDPAGVAAANEPWFGDDNDSGATTNTEDIYHMGNIGIGTTDPGTFRLNVQGGQQRWSNSAANTDHTIDFSTPGSETGFIFNAAQTGNRSRFDIRNVDNATAGDRVFSLTYNGDPGLYIRKGGNVGINASQPTQRLDVNGTGLFRNGDSWNHYADNQIMFSHGGGNGYKSAIRTRHHGSNDVYNAIDFYTWDYGVNAITDDPTLHGLTIAGGRVGVAQRVPSTFLHVLNTNALNGTHANNINAILRLQRNGTSGTKYSQNVEFRLGTYEASLSARTRLDITMGLGNTNHVDRTPMTIRADGRVGINERHTPEYNLDVNGTFRNTSRGLFTVMGGNDDMVVTATNPRKGIRMWNWNDNSWGIYMTRNGAGRAFDGSTAVAGHNFTGHSIRFRVYDYNNATAGFIFENSNDELLASIRGQDGSAYFGGNVGIGQSAPSEKLEVNGTIKATDINFTGLPTYADEAAATAGGLSTGDMYKTATGELRIKL